MRIVLHRPFHLHTVSERWCQVSDIVRSGSVASAPDLDGICASMSDAAWKLVRLKVTPPDRHDPEWRD